VLQLYVYLPEPPLSMHLKRQLMTALEIAATTVEGPLYRIGRPGDPASNAHWHDATSAIAAAFREKKLWLLAPKADTVTQLRAWLRQAALTVTAGTLGDLERLGSTTQPHARTWLKLIATTIQAAVVAGIPFGALALLQASRFALGQESAVYFGVGATIWAAVVLVTSVDPLLHARIGMLRDLGTILRR